MKGYIIGIIEIILFFIGSIFLREQYSSFQTINKAIYFWVMMTILTGIWEIAYLSNFYEVSIMSKNLIKNNEHTWTNDFDISYVLPWKLSKIFYAEYGAWADREYMGITDNWSKIIEGSHCTQCALFSLIAILFKLNGNHNNYLISLGVAMGTQFMNSFLYMFAYFIQEKTPSSINYITEEFPSDIWLIERPFMWVNIFWLFLPFYTIFYYLYINKKKLLNMSEKQLIKL